MTQFWTNFWPNLAATVIGVALGLPFAFWLNRKAVAWGENARRKDERDEISNCLLAIRLTITTNLTRLKAYQAAVSTDNTLFDTGFDTSAWAALQGGLTSELADPELRQELARFFTRLSRLGVLNDRLGELLIAGNLNTLGSGNARRRLMEEIPGAVVALLADGASLLTRIDSALERLSK